MSSKYMSALKKPLITSCVGLVTVAIGGSIAFTHLPEDTSTVKAEELAQVAATVRADYLETTRQQVEVKAVKKAAPVAQAAEPKVDIPADPDAASKSSNALRSVAVPAATGVQNDDQTEAVRKAQQEYISSAIAYEDKQRETIRLTNESKVKVVEAKRLTTEWDKARVEAERLRAVADEKQKVAAQWSISVYKGNSAAMDPTAQLLTSSPEDMSKMIDRMGRVTSTSRVMSDQIRVAQIAHKEATDAEQAANKIKQKADAAAAEATALAEQSKAVEGQALELNAESDAKAQDLTAKINVAEISTGTFSPISAGQRVLDAAAVGHWNDYLDKLTKSKLVLPSSEQLKNPEKFLPAGLEPVLGVDGRPLAGVAKQRGTNLTVLPVEVVEDVSKALSVVGTAYGTANTLAQSCETFVGSMYGAGPEVTLRDMWGGAQQQTETLNRVPGDVVYYSDPLAGITQAGVYLGANLAVSASATSGYVEVNKVDVNALGVNRPSTGVLDPAAMKPAPPVLPGALDWKCGGIAGAVNADAENPWTLPIPSGSYEVGAKFAEKNVDRWGEEASPGLEFTAADNFPVVAASSGLASVTLNDPVWGNYVTISHIDGMTSRYTNLGNVTIADGASIKAGAVLGTVGKSGTSANKEKSSVLVSITIDGEEVDPQLLFFPPEPVLPPVVAQGGESVEGAGVPTGSVASGDGWTIEVSAEGFQNGKLPAEVLSDIGGGHQMRSDAARAFPVLNAAFKAHFGRDISITDSYRPYADQVAVRAAKPGLAAKPGTSKHGWGLALDLGGGINRFGTAEHQWMVQNAEKYGFYHPSWARQGGSKPEAWHWEYIATKGM